MYKAHKKCAEFKWKNSSNNKIKLNVDISNDQINIKTYTLYK